MTVTDFMEADVNTDQEYENGQKVTANSPAEVRDGMKSLFSVKDKGVVPYSDYSHTTSQSGSTEFDLVNAIVRTNQNKRPSNDQSSQVNFDATMINRYNLLAAYVNEAIPDQASPGGLSFLPRGSTNNPKRIYDVATSEYDIGQTVRFNTQVTGHHGFPMMIPLAFGSEGQVGGGIVTDRLSYCSDNQYLRNHYDNQTAALEKNGITLSEKSKDKVNKLFTELESIQVRLCKLLRQRELAISAGKELGQATKDAIKANTGPGPFEAVLQDLVKAHRKANQKILSLNVTLEKVIADQLTKVLDKRDAENKGATGTDVDWYTGLLKKKSITSPKGVSKSVKSEMTAQAIFDALNGKELVDLDEKITKNIEGQFDDIDKLQSAKDLNLARDIIEKFSWSTEAKKNQYKGNDDLTRIAFKNLIMLDGDESDL